MKKWLSLSCMMVVTLLVLGLSACSGGNSSSTSTGNTTGAPAIARVRMWLTLNDDPNAPPVTTLTPEQTVQASIWARGTTEKTITFKVNLNYGDKFTTLVTGVRTEGSSKAVSVGALSTPLEPGNYTFQAVSGALGEIVGSSLQITVTPPLEQPDKATFQKYFSDMGLGKIPTGGKLPQDLQQNVTVFSSGDQFTIYGTVIQEVQASARYYNVATKQSVDAPAAPTPLKVGGFAGSSTLTLPVGKYDCKVYVGAVLVAVFPFEVIATLTTTPSSQPTPQPSPKSSEQPDKATFSIYFRDMGLGKITTGGKLPQDLQQNVTVFAVGDQLTLYGNIIKECQQPRYEIYYVQVNKVVKGGGLSFPTIKPGFDAVGFISVDTLDLPVGNYEYKVYIGDVFVAVFPFEVR
jgi:hypothetical protein